MDHGLWDNKNGFLNYNSLFLKFGFDEGESVNEYVNQIMQLIATDTNFIWVFIIGNIGSIHMCIGMRILWGCKTLHCHHIRKAEMI